MIHFFNLGSPFYEEEIEGRYRLRYKGKNQTLDKFKLLNHKLGDIICPFKAINIQLIVFKSTGKIKHSSTMEFVIGTRVEFGLRLLNDDGTPLEESISMRSLRPCPSEVEARFMVGDIVDAWHNDGWWPGRYIGRDGDNYKVYFENMDPQPKSFLIPKVTYASITSGRP
ncbi:hypothetical protein LXL04_037660 [Taraxacum kok-saghyz]